MRQALCDLYKVTFNDVKRLPEGSQVVHFQDREDIIKLGKDETIIVGEPYLEALSRYGGGFKTKELVKENCTWLGRAISEKLGASNSNPAGRFRLQRVDKV